MAARLPNVLPARRLPVVLAVAVYLAGFAVGYLLVAADLDWKCGPDGLCIWTSAPWKFWFSVPVVPAGVTWAVARRLLNGPAVDREDLVLFFGAPASAGRAAAGPQVRDVVAALEQVGYTPRVWALDEALRPVVAAGGGEALLGARFLVQEARSRVRQGYLRLLLPAPGARGTGMLEVSDSPAGLYTELASFLIVSLSSLLPDLRFRRLNSSLPPDPVAALSVPARPQRLPG